MVHHVKKNNPLYCNDAGNAFLYLSAFCLGSHAWGGVSISRPGPKIESPGPEYRKASQAL